MKRQVTKFEVYAHDVQYRKKNRVDHGQLGDHFFEKSDWAVTVATIILVLFGLGMLAVIY